MSTTTSLHMYRGGHAKSRENFQLAQKKQKEKASKKKKEPVKRKKPNETTNVGLNQGEGIIGMHLVALKNLAKKYLDSVAIV